MQSGSPPTTPSGRSTHTMANIIGTAIALITLILPILMIGHYAPSSSPSIQPSPVADVK